MCWNFGVSITTAIFSTIAGLFLLLHRKQEPFPFYGLSLLGVTSMQWAEAYLWYYGDVAGETCILNNKYGTQVLVPMAVMVQPLLPFLGAYLSTNKYTPAGNTLRKISKVYIGFCIMYKILNPIVYWIFGGNKTFLWVTTLCTTITKQGYLYWGAPVTLLPLLFWWALVATPVIIYLPLKGILISLYGLMCLLISYYFTDSVGSNWCLYVTGYSLIGLYDYYIIINKKTKEKQN